jgi:ribosomal protein S12 methylthiotransferase accessory factor
MIFSIEKREIFENFLPPHDSLKLIAEKTGLIQNIFENYTELDELAVPSYTIHQPRFDRILNAPFELEFRAGAVGLTPRDSMMRLIGELVERYGMSMYDDDSIIFCTYNELEKKGVEALGPNDLPLFSKKQHELPGFLFHKFTKDAKIGWTEGINLATNRRILVPAQLVYLAYRFRSWESCIGYVTSNGCAAASTYEESLLKAACEAIERDAAMITWYSKLSPPKLDISSDEWLDEIYSVHFKCENIEYRLLNITLDTGVPMVMCVCVDLRGHDPIAVLGGSANLNPKHAALKALLEAGQCRSYAKYLTLSSPQPHIDPFRIMNLDDNLRYYAIPKNFEYLTFLFASEKSIKLEEIPDASTGDIKRDLKVLVKKMSERGFTLLAIDLTSPDIEKVGFCVTKVMIPELVPLSMPAAPYFGNPRFYEVPLRLGYTDKILTEEDLNQMPHPYP